MTEPLTTERIDGEFYFGVADSLGRSWNIFRLGELLPLEAVEHAEADKAWLLSGDRIARLDTEARHHREAERQKINEMAAGLFGRWDFVDIGISNHPEIVYHVQYGAYPDAEQEADGSWSAADNGFLKRHTGPDFLAALTEASTQGESA